MHFGEHVTKPSYLILASLATLGIGSFSALGSSMRETTLGKTNAVLDTPPADRRSPPRAALDAQAPEVGLQLGSQSQAAGLGTVRRVVAKAVAEMIPAGEDAAKVARTRKAIEEVLVSGYEALPPQNQKELQTFARKNRRNNQAVMRKTFLTLGPGYQKLGQILSSRGDLLSAEAQKTMASFTDSLPQYYGRETGNGAQNHTLRRMNIRWDAEQSVWRRATNGHHVPRTENWRAQTDKIDPVMSGEYEAALRSFDGLDSAVDFGWPLRVLPQIWDFRSHPHRSPSLLGTGSVAEAYLIHGVDMPDLTNLRHTILTNGELVTKLTKRDIAGQLEANIASMMHGLDRAEPEARQALEPMLDDIRFMASRETDLRYEARAMNRAQRIFRDSNAQVPDVIYGIDDLVLMKRAPGGNILDNLPADKAARTALASDIGADVFEMLEDGFFHGDLHAGNILYDGTTRTYLDWGLYVELDTSTRKSLTSLFQAAHSRDEAAALEALRTLDGDSGKVTDADLMAAIRQTFERSEHDMQALQGLVGNARLAGFDLPPGVGLAAKSLYQVDGVLRMIDPGFDYANAAKVYARRFAKDAGKNPVESYRRARDLMDMLGFDASDIRAAIAQSAPVRQAKRIVSEGISKRVSRWRANRQAND